MAMSKYLLEQDNFYKLTKTSNTVCTLGSLTVNTAISGVGGLDTGTIAASTFYYVYTVFNSGALYLIASTSAANPTGFSSNYRKVGAFYTDSSSNIFKAYRYNEVNVVLYSAKVSSTAVVSDQSSSFVSGSVNNSGGTYTTSFISGVFSLTPNCTVISSGGSQYGLTDLSNTSISQVRYSLINASVATNHTVFAHKQGVDAVQPDWSR